MPELVELLSLLYTGHRNIDAMVLTVRDTMPRPASNVLVAERDQAGAVHMRWMGGGPNAEPAGATRQIWFQPPDRIRVEIVRGREVVRAAVRNGTTWWRWDQDEGEMAGDVEQGRELPLLLDIPLLRPERLLQSMLLEVTGTGRRASREALTAQGVPRENTAGTARVEYEFDRAYGTPLYVAWASEGEPASVSEVTEIDYASAIEPDVFTFQKRSGYAAGSRGRRTRPRSVNPQNSHRRHPATRAALARLGTVWLTGFSGAGKTTIARATERLLHQLGLACCVIDGDQLRQGLSSDLGLSREDRREQARRAAHMAAMLADAGVIPIVALVSPYAEDRQRAREIHAAAAVAFVEVWVDTPIEVCAARDHKGLYAGADGAPDAADGPPDGSGLTGVTAPYEAPSNPELRVSGHGQHPRAAAEAIVARMFTTPTRSQILVVADLDAGV